MTFRAITATLRLRTALHIGTGQDSETTDDLLRREDNWTLTNGSMILCGKRRFPQVSG